ncbi:MAG: aminopeptidase P family protein [Bacteroidetes bacterium]|nr:aminopeptidase P family protein [Bacteroidota bacterium]
MFATEIYQNRRKSLIDNIDTGIIIFLGNQESGMNYKDNPYSFRQDSTFLYYFGIDKPDLHAVIDIDSGNAIIFGNELSVDEIVWMGQQTTLKELAGRVGVSKLFPGNQMETYLKEAQSKGRKIHILPPYRPEHSIQLSNWLSVDLKGVSDFISEEFIKAVVNQRSIKGSEEVEEMEKALVTTREMHVAAMENAREGMKEVNLVGSIHGIAVRSGGNLAYPIILSVNGQILHNHYYGNTLKNGQLLLGDFGAETAMHYAGDITRTFPVGRKFTERQKEIYQIVLDAEVESIKAMKPGKTYKEVHLFSARLMAEGLKDLGIMKGNLDDAIVQGAHALFFPHGLGHMIGMDVHDMENLGEQYVGYDPSVERSTQFGFKYLRMGRALQPGFVLTVEPGLYFIPELIDQWKADGRFKDFINYDLVETYKDFGGVRIEDNVLITEDGCKILGPPIPKTIEEVEAIRGSMV